MKAILPTDRQQDQEVYSAPKRECNIMSREIGVGLQILAQIARRIAAYSGCV